MTAPAYRYRASRCHRGRPSKADGVDDVKVRLACRGERVDLTVAERREAVRLLSAATGVRAGAPNDRGYVPLAPMSSNEIARRLDLSWRSVQRIRAAIRATEVAGVRR